ncbi:MAG: transcription antitermination protein NusB [Bacteroidales bacterium]|nr:transcription antitermination protein NusB [Bacteroidales bacterium]
MLNRRMLRVKAFKILYSYAENRDMTLKEALAALDKSCEATRDLSVYLLSIVLPLTAEAGRQAEALRLKFNPTEEELHPNLKFVHNALVPLLESDPDFRKFLERKKLSWDQDDALVHRILEAVKARPYYAAYLAEPEVSLAQDIKLFKKIFENEFEDDDALWDILEERSIDWAGDLSYALSCVVKMLEGIGRTGRWELPPLYQSEILAAQGKSVDSDRAFVQRLLTVTFGHFADYYGKVAGSVRGWDRDRLFTTDIVLIAMGLAEAETFPEIPVRVTINEYVELSKYFSTPKSRSFVNGILDRLIRESAAEGRIPKPVDPTLSQS